MFFFPCGVLLPGSDRSSLNPLFSEDQLPLLFGEFDLGSVASEVDDGQRGAKRSGEWQGEWRRVSGASEELFLEWGEWGGELVFGVECAE